MVIYQFAWILGQTILDFMFVCQKDENNLFGGEG